MAMEDASGRTRLDGSFVGRRRVWKDTGSDGQICARNDAFFLGVFIGGPLHHALYYAKVELWGNGSSKLSVGEKWENDYRSNQKALLASSCRSSVGNRHALAAWKT